MNPYAVFVGIQKGFKEIKDFALYTIFWEGHCLDRSTVSIQTLKRLGITDIKGA